MSYSRDDGNSGVFEDSSNTSLDGFGDADSIRRDCPSCDMNLPLSVRLCPNDGTDMFMTADELFAGKYQLIEEIGCGAIGTIYKAKHVALDSFVAIKVLSQVTGDKKSFLRFQREAKAASKITHPNVINVFDFGVWHDCQPYMVMDYLEGETLDQYYRNAGSMSVVEIIDIMLPVANALSHAHSSGILHRDLKPSNIMILKEDDKNGARVKLLDFGLAKMLFRDDGVSLSASGVVLGSPAFMSPEQATGRSVDTRTDLYSFGCIIYELFTGEPPLLGQSAAETFMKRVNYDAPAVSTEIDFYIPTRLDALISRCIQRNPQDRCKSAAWVYGELMAIKHSIVSGESRNFASEEIPVVQSGIVEQTTQQEVSSVEKVSGEHKVEEQKAYIDLSFIPADQIVSWFKRLPYSSKVVLILSAILVLALILRIVIQ